MDAFLEDGKWIFRHKGFCLPYGAGVDSNAPIQVNPEKRTKIPISWASLILKSAHNGFNLIQIMPEPSRLDFGLTGVHMTTTYLNLGEFALVKNLCQNPFSNAVVLVPFCF